MVQETEEVNAEHETGTAFLNLLPDTPQKYLGLYNDAHPQDSKTATLRNMLMVRRNYDALGLRRRRLRRLRREERAARDRRRHRSLHAAALPRQGRSAARESRRLEEVGARRNSPHSNARNPEEYDLFRQAVAHLLMGLGGEDDKDTKARIAAPRLRSPTRTS